MILFGCGLTHPNKFESRIILQPIIHKETWASAETWALP